MWTLSNSNFEGDDGRYEQLREPTKRHGLTWKEMMLYAQEQLDSERRD